MGFIPIKVLPLEYLTNKYIDYEDNRKQDSGEEEQGGL